MTLWLLIRRGLRFHARSHFGVVLGAAIGTAALVGALIVGDSVRGSLRERALNRLGSVQYALSTHDRFFRQDLAERLQSNEARTAPQSGATSTQPTSPPEAAAVLQVLGVAARQDGRARANQVNVLGIDLATWPPTRPLPFRPGLAGNIDSSNTLAGNLDLTLSRAGLSRQARDAWNSGESVFLNQALAHQLGVAEGDEIILRIRKSTQLAQDAVINPRNDTSLALRLRVGPILSPALLGDFSLVASQSPPPNAFLPLQFLAHQLGLDSRGNLVLQGPMPAKDSASVSTEEALKGLTERLENSWTLEDAQLSVRTIAPPEVTRDGERSPASIEVRSSRIFLEPKVIAAALQPRTRLLTGHQGFGFTNDILNAVASTGFVTNGTGIVTYLANLIRDGNRATPYSMITAAGGDFLPADLRDDEILLNEWLANDLQAKVGDSIQVSYYAVDSASRLTEHTNSFKVRGVVPITGRYADRSLMPEFPGVAKAESTQDWDTGFPLIYKIREQDEAYWKRYRGTPKAFVTLAAGQAMWANRFGALTAIRYQVPRDLSPDTCRDLVYKNLLANLNPADLGFRFEPAREQALQAADQSQDFGQLFIGFSIFLVVAALLLMALLFQFSLEQRRVEVGVLLALGWRRRQVRRLLLREGMFLALLGGIAGAGAGFGYAKAMLWALTTVWRDAIGGAVLGFHASLGTLLIGLFASTLVAILTIWLTLRKQARQPARELLSGELTPSKRGRAWLAKWLAAGSTLAGLAIAGYAIVRGEATDAEAFFEAGSLLLIAGLAWTALWFSSLEQAATSADLSFAGLGVRACTRRRKRSLATIALLASGCFVIVSIGVFRLDADQGSNKHSSGTGGFALIGQATLPVIPDLNTESGREFFGLSGRDLTGVSAVSFRVRDGDEASCLNLNRAQRPRLLGVKPEQLTNRFTFAAAAKGLDLHQGWQLLKAGALSQADEIPAIGDANSIQWALGKSLGDTLDYTDERGRTFKLRLVGAVANSVLQGSLIIDEAEFVKKFPTESGYRYFLIDAPPAATASVSAVLSRALQDNGMELSPAAARLNAFNAVQNTYLGTFQILGGLGLLLGSAGLGVVVLRNVLERRGELGLLAAVGFRKRSLFWLVLTEHGALLGLGLGLGIITAAVAVLPAELSPARQLPYASLAVTLGAVLLNGLIWTWLATRLALRGNLLAALRNE